MFEVEAAELDRAGREETEAVAVMEQKRADEIERGRKEIMHDPIKEAIQESEALPVCTRTPRLLVIGKVYLMSLVCKLMIQSVCINGDPR